MEPAASPGDVPAGRDRWLSALSLAAGLGLLLWMGRSVATGDVPFTGDLLHLHYPLRDFYARALGRGEPVAWMPSLFNGFYVLGEGQLGAYHPFHWALYRWLPLTTAFAIEILSAYPFLFAGTWLWLRRWCGAGPASFGALLFTASGFTLSHGAHPNMVGVIAHLPWLLWSVDGVLASATRRIGARWVVAIGALIASQLLLGHPQAAWIAGLAVATYSLWGLWAVAPPGRGGAVALVVAGAALGMVMGAVQILATLHAVSTSVRPAFDASFATQFSLTPAQLAQVVQPYLAWGRILRWNELPGAGDEYGVYAGGAGLLMGTWWLAYRWASPRPADSTGASRMGLWAAGVGALGLWLSTGGHGGLYLVQTWLPVVGQFRAPVRYIVFTQFALATLAACAAATLSGSRAGSPGARRALWVPWSLTVFVLGLTVVLGGVPADGGAPRLAAAWIGPLTFVLMAVLLTLAVRGARWALPALVICAAVDQGLYGIGGVIAWQDVVARTEVVPLLGSTGGRPRPDAGRIMRGGFPNLYLLDGYRLVDGYVAITPRRHLRYDSLAALRLSSVSFAHKDALPASVTVGRPLLGNEWFAIPDPLARARLVSRALVSRTPDADVETIDHVNEALVERPVALDAGTGGAATVTRDVPGGLDVRITASGAQLLVVSESFDDGWTGTLDGSPVDVLRVNGDFLGCVVPAGSHDVELRFRPSHLVWGSRVSLMGSGVAAMLLVWGCRRPRGEMRTA